MRIVSYNIMNGGQGRADPLAEVLEAQKPDIVALVEADDPQVLNRIASRLKFDAICAAGRKHAAALLSRYPIIESINHAMIDPSCIGSLLEVVIKIPGFEYLNIAVSQWGIFMEDSSMEDSSVTHRDQGIKQGTDESGADIGEKNIGKLLGPFARLRQDHRPHIIISNFTSERFRRWAASPSSPAVGQKSTAVSELPTDKINTDLRLAIQSVLDAGYHDVLSDAAIPHESKAGTGSFSTQSPHWLPDRIFAFGLESHHIGRTWIERDRLARYASDHFPVAVEFNI